MQSGVDYREGMACVVPETSRQRVRRGHSPGTTCGSRAQATGTQRTWSPPRRTPHSTYDLGPAPQTCRSRCSAWGSSHANCCRYHGFTESTQHAPALHVNLDCGLPVQRLLTDLNGWSSARGSASPVDRSCSDAPHAPPPCAARASAADRNTPRTSGTPERCRLRSACARGATPSVFRLNP